MRWPLSKRPGPGGGVKASSVDRVIVDTTLMTKAIAHPPDTGRILLSGIERVGGFSPQDDRLLCAGAPARDLLGRPIYRHRLAGHWCGADAGGQGHQSECVCEGAAGRLIRVCSPGEL